MPDLSHKPTYPHAWSVTLTAPLSEGNVEVYLEVLSGALTTRYVPTQLILQSLIYYTLHPPTTTSPEPIALLEKILSQHPAEVFTTYALIPVYPRKRGLPTWLDYEVSGEHEIQIKKYMRRAEKEGVWALLWDHNSARSGSEEEDEESGAGGRRVSENGWEVLRWLVALWEQDQLSHRGCSLAFLDQLPKLPDMQYDNPTLPLEVLRSVIDHPSPNAQEQQRRQNTAGRLMALLIKTATCTPPRFHPATLSISFLPLFRLESPHLHTLLSILSPHLPGGVYAHLLTRAVEDHAGLKRPRKQDAGLAQPSIQQVLNLLVLPSRAGARGPILKLALVRAMRALEPSNEAWRTAAEDEAWMGKLEGCMTGPNVDGIKQAISLVMKSN